MRRQLTVAAVLAALAPAAAAAGPAQAASRPVVDGTWEMKFRTTYNRGFRGPEVGTRYTRAWFFERHCDANGCRLRAQRETSTHGYVTLRVRRSGSVYRAVWRTRARCRKAGTFPYTETVTFTVSDSVLIAGRRLASRVSGRLVGRSPARGCQRQPGEAHDRMSGTRTDLPEAPEAEFSYEPGAPSVSTGATVFFTSTSYDVDGEPIAWDWDFGDPAAGAANTATGERPAHTYTMPGTFRVMLTVTDSDGLQSTTEQFVNVTR